MSILSGITIVTAQLKTVTRIAWLRLKLLLPLLRAHSTFLSETDTILSRG